MVPGSVSIVDDDPDITEAMERLAEARPGRDFKAEAGDHICLPMDEFLDQPVRPATLLEKVRGFIPKP